MWGLSKGSKTRFPFRPVEPAEAATLASEAVKAWPRLPALKAPHKMATERFQRIAVGVVAPTGDHARLVMIAEEQAGPTGLPHGLL